MNSLELKQAIETLNLVGKNVCVHSSMRSFGALERCADSIIDCFLESNCTLMVPTMSFDFAVPPPKDIVLPQQNGCDYEAMTKDFMQSTKIFTDQCNDICVEEMGILAQCVLMRTKRKRGNHPINSFTALGKNADILIKDQTPTDVFAPFASLCEHNGFVLLMGVNLTRATILHYAEFLAGRKPFIQWAKNESGQVIPVRIGSCSGGFEKLERFTQKICTELQVGKSEWKLYPAKELVKICVQVILETPEVTQCGNPMCMRCKDAIKGGPVW